MNESQRVVDLLTEIRDEIRELREKSSRHYEEVLVRYEAANDRNMDEWRQHASESQGSWKAFSIIFVIALVAYAASLAFR
jgi:rRNA maturation endonuclease Nob1